MSLNAALPGALGAELAGSAACSSLALAPSGYCDQDVGNVGAGWNTSAEPPDRSALWPSGTPM
jgi:hypothetical protein